MSLIGRVLESTRYVGVTHKLIKLIKLIKLTLQLLSPSCRYWCELRKRP